MTPVLTLDWWLTPLSGANEHDLPNWLIWHARSMVLAWAVLLPLGALAARYFKVTPRQDWPRTLDSKAWWHAHRGLQYLGVGLMLFGTWLAWDGAAPGKALTLSACLSAVGCWHAWLGWALLLAGALQVIGGWFRGSKGGPTEASVRGDHYDMTARRLRFERIHKGLGWAAIAVAVATTVMGLIAADAPRWMPGVLGIWWLALAALARRWQRQGRCIDTYQAIWGPDPSHPGNAMPAQGWGTRRPGTGTTTDTPLT